MKKLTWIILLGIIFNINSYSQTDREFWFAIPKITVDNCVGGDCPGGKPLYFRFATLDFPAHVIIDMPATGDTIAEFNIPAFTDYTLDLTAQRALIEVLASNSTSNQGIHIVSNNLVTVFYEFGDGIQAKNSEMWVLKGKHALGQMFYVPTQNIWANENLADHPVNAIYIVGTSDSPTDVEITLAADAGIYNAGDVVTVTLDKGEVYAVVAKNYTGPDHLGGTKVEVTNGNDVVVIVSDDSIGPSGNKDTNGDQLIPVDYIGYNYVVMDGPGSNDKAFVIPSVDGTEIFVNGVTQGFYNAGDMVRFDIIDVTLIETSEPSWVYNIASFGVGLGGAILPASDGCTGSYDVTIFRTNTQKFVLNIMVPFAGIDGFDILYDDGTSYHMDPGWFIPADPADPAGYYVLSGANNEFADGYGGGVPKDVATKVVNTLEVFHLGVISTRAANYVKYGYFSDFGKNTASVEVIDATIPGSEARIACFGDSVQLLARGGTSYEWYDQLTGEQKYLTPSPYIANPVLVDLPVFPLYKYDVHVSGSCADDTLTVYVKINPNVKALYQVDKAIGCAPLDVNIDNLTNGANRFLWDFDGDGTWEVNTADSAYVNSYTYDNNQPTDTSYTTRLYVENIYNCYDLYERTVYVHPKITAGFDQDVDNGCNPLYVQFTDTSSGNLYQNYWDFGDGVSAIDTINPVHLFQNTNNTDTTYTVTLINTSPYNCKDTAVKDITVNPYIEARFSIDRNVGCAPFNVTVSNLSRGGISNYYWDYNGDGTVDSNTANDTIITFTNLTNNPIDDTLRLVVANAAGCTDTVEKIIRIYPVINADYSLDNNEGCNTLDVIFTNNSTGASIVDWDFGDGISSNSTAATVNHTYNNYFTHDTVFTFTLDIESDYGCFDDTSGTVTVHRTVADFKIDTARGCSPLNVNIINTSIGDINTFEWYYGDGTPVDNSINPGNHLYTNATGITALNNLKLKVIGNGTCADSLTLPIDVYSEITADFTPVNVIGCDSTEVAFVNNSSAWASIHDWTFGDGTNSNIVNPTHVYRNFTGADVFYKTLLKVTSADGCMDTVSTNIQIHPFIKADFSIDPAFGCSPFDLDVEAVVYAGIGTYNWDFDNGNTPSGINPVIQTYVNKTGVTNNYSIELSVIDVSGNCYDTLILPIDVYSESKADFLPMAFTDCNPNNITFNGTLASNALLYNWDFGDGGTSNLQNPYHSFINSTDATVNYPVSLEVTSANGCTHDTSTVISVLPYVLADFDVNIVSGCSPLVVEITNNSRGGDYRFFWDDDDLTIADSSFIVNNNFIKTYYNSSGSTQNFNLTLIANNGLGCTDTLQRTITVFSSITASFNSSVTEGCHPLSVQFTNTTIGGTLFNWDFGDGTSSNLEDPLHVYNNFSTKDTTYTAVNLVAESGDGCTDTSYSNITVYSYVNASFSISDDKGCPPFNTTAVNSSIGNAANTFDWYVDNVLVSNSADLNYTYNNATTNLRYYPVRLEYKNSHNCIDIHRDTVTVYEFVDASYDVPLTEDCQPFSVSFNNTSVAPASVTYYWDFGDNAKSNVISPTHLYENTTFNDITFTSKLLVESQNACKDSMELDITAYSYVKALFSINDNEGCPPFTTLIDNTSLGNINNTYQWEINGTPLASPTDNSDFNYNFINNNSTILDYNIKLTATNNQGCSSLYQDVVRVYEKVFADFDMSNYTGCTPLNIDFVNNSIAPVLTTYYWDFGDGASSAIEEPNHTFFNSSRTLDKSYTVGLTVTSPYYCTDDTTIEITVYHKPLSKFFIDNTSSCPPLVSFLEKQSAGEDSYEWRFGDGNTNTSNPSLTYTYPNTLVDVVQNYTLELWVGTDEGCKDSTSLELNVFPDVVADFTYDESGCSPFVSSFINTSTDPAEYFYWNFDDGNTSNQENPVYRFVNTLNTDKVYNVFLKASSEYNCWDTITKPVTAFAQPIAEFDVSPIVQKFPENRVFFDNKSNIGPWDYSWDFGDSQSSTIADPSFHDYEHWGEYDITLTINSLTSICNDYIVKNITITPPDVNAAFTSNVSEGCLQAGFTVDFIASASAYSEVYTYEWDFGDGSAIETGSNVSHEYTSAGTYYVKLTARGESGEDFEYKTIKVHSNPKANFDVIPKLATLNNNLEARVEFYNLSECNDTSGCSYLWDFGDGETSLARDVTHNYSEIGIYDVALYVTTSIGCTDSLILLDEIEVIGEGEIKFPNAFTPNGDELNDKFRPVYEGVVEYELLIYNRWGELIFKTNDLTDGWDGTLDGELAKSDVYVWKAMGKFTNGKPFEIAGDVTLIR